MLSGEGFALVWRRGFRFGYEGLPPETDHEVYEQAYRLGAAMAIWTVDDAEETAANARSGHVDRCRTELS
jgi:hypothetical protein